MVSMPYLGRTSFLRGKESQNALSRISVNALSRAHFISTFITVLVIAMSTKVSMPYLGRTSFLRSGGRVWKMPNACVNALSRAHFISTPREKSGKYVLSELCQCPISGALHFYAAREVGEICIVRIVSMPYLGRTSFLQRGKNENIYICNVSMPYLGRTSFLPPRRTFGKRNKEFCVNALSRAHFISTCIRRCGNSRG